MTDEQVQGKLDQAKGEVKEDVGKVTGDSSMEKSGTLDKIKGEIEELVGDVKEKFGHHDDAPRPDLWVEASGRVRLVF